MKVISKARFTRHSDQKYHFDSLRAEIEVMQRMSHPNIIKLYEVYESASDLYLVMECCSGGELFDRIKEQGSYTEQDASAVMRQMTEGIRYMHANGIAHCDLKPDNFLFFSQAKDAPIKIIDFGMSKFVQKRKYFQVICGTPVSAAHQHTTRRLPEHRIACPPPPCSRLSPAVASASLSPLPAVLRSTSAKQHSSHHTHDLSAISCPLTLPCFCFCVCSFCPLAAEVITGRYSEHCDMWSLGVVMFVMLFGYPPFYADQDKYGSETDERIFKLIQHGFQPVTKAGYGPHFPSAIPCSDSAKDLISKLLQMDPAKRWTAAEALEHPWMTGENASKLPVLSNVLHNLRAFQANYKFKQAVLTMMSSSLSETEVEELKKTFKAIDANGDGTITQTELRTALQGSNPGSASEQMLHDIETLIKMADVDGDGKLSYNELLLTCIQKRLAAKEERLWEAFCKLDLNNDGKVSAEELRQVLVRNERDAKELIKDVDVDGDGMVSYEEFLSMWKAQEEKQKEMQGGATGAAPMVK